MVRLSDPVLPAELPEPFAPNMYSNRPAVALNKAQSVTGSVEWIVYLPSGFFFCRWSRLGQVFVFLTCPPLLISFLLGILAPLASNLTSNLVPTVLPLSGPDRCSLAAS